MKIEYRKGDLLTSDEKIILHGCNACGVFRSGIAKSIRESFPNAYKVYMKQYENNGLNLGDVIWDFESKKIIGNLVTQESYGRDKAQYVDYNAIRIAIKNVNNIITTISNDELPRVGLPLIGAGLGGGKWSIISSIIEEESTNFQPVVYTLDNIPNN